MTHDEFVGQVQARARLASRGAAEAAIRAVFETLAERLQSATADHLAAQLPQELARHLRSDVEFQRLSADEFLRRVCEREGPHVELPDSVYHARGVIEVLEEAVPPGIIEKVRASLPSEFQRLFESGSKGQLKKQEREVPEKEKER